MKNAIGSSLLSLLIALGTDPAGATAPCKNHYILTDPDPCALSMPGTLDPTFGGSGFALFGGEVVQPFWAYAIAMQPDGKSVVAGGQPATAGAIVNRTVLARFLPDGSLDPGFGAGGIALTPSAHDVGVASEVIVQADLKILVAGAPYTDGISRTTQRFALARYHPDGTLDTDFGNGGSVFTAIGHSSDLRRLLVRADGTILAAGSICAARSCEGALARYTASGKPDLAFGDGGVVVFGDAGPITIGLQTDGKFVASLPNLRPDEKYDPYVTGRLIRVDAEGKLDVDFGQGGTIFTHFVAGAILVDATGRIVIAGATRIADPDHARLTLARYHSNGAPDSTFGDSGIAAYPLTRGSFGSYGVPFTADEDYVGALNQQADGKLVASGWSGNIDASDILIARYTADGRLDSTFGERGFARTFVTGGDASFGAVLQDDGKLLLAGSIYGQGGGAIRYRNDKVVEFHNRKLDRYFITSNPEEQVAILGGVAGAGWELTGEHFASNGPSPTCRFVGTSGFGPNSHFFSIDPAECRAVADQSRWHYEGSDFNAAAPLPMGRCAAGRRPVYRAYNEGFATNNSKHRYMTSATLYESLTASGWIGEGAVFCVPE